MSSRYIKNNDGAIWFIQKAPPKHGEMLDAFIKSRHFTNLIVSPHFFPEKILEVIENGLDLTNNGKRIVSEETPPLKSFLSDHNKPDEELSKKKIVTKDNPMKIFISYSHKDEQFKDELVTMLTSLQRRGVIDAWQDRRIEEGDEWYQDIQDAMNDCELAILLISANFLASPFIQDEEIPKLLKRRMEEDLRVIPIIVKQCMWQSEPAIKDIQVLPRDGKPVITFSKDNGDRDQVWTDIAKVIEKRAKK